MEFVFSIFHGFNDFNDFGIGYAPPHPHALGESLEAQALKRQCRAIAFIPYKNHNAPTMVNCKLEKGTGYLQSPIFR